jgi:hypothetical protein
VQGFGSVWSWPVPANSSVGVAREDSETVGHAVLAAISLHLQGWLSCAMDPCPELSLSTLNTVVFLKGIMHTYTQYFYFYRKQQKYQS